MPDPEAQAGQRAVHDAATVILDDGEIALRWVLVIDAAGPGGARYLAHRAGAGHDGTDPVTTWEVIGMLQQGLDVARDQAREQTTDADDDA